MVIIPAAPPNEILVAPELSKLNPVDVVLIPVRIVGSVPKTRSPVPVLSGTRPRICVEVVEANVARVSDVYATLPPCLKLTLTADELLSDVRTRSLLTSRVLLVAISITADAVDAISRPLIDVAVAVPRIGAVSVGDVRVLFVRTCVSVSVTNLFSTDPSQDAQYPGPSFQRNAIDDVTFPEESVVLFNVIPPLVPVKLFPLLNSISLSSTMRV